MVLVLNIAYPCMRFINLYEYFETILFLLYIDYCLVVNVVFYSQNYYLVHDNTQKKNAEKKTQKLNYQKHESQQIESHSHFVELQDNGTVRVHMKCVFIEQIYIYVYIHNSIQFILSQTKIKSRFHFCCDKVQSSS